MAKSAKQLPELKNRVLSPKQSKRSHFVLGAWGERAAARFLVAHGYRILDVNIGWGQYELDIVALDREHNEVVFVEVKTRQTSWFGPPSNAVGRQKRRSLNRIAAFYLRSRGLRNDYRFDIISVTPEGVEHFENVTWP